MMETLILEIENTFQTLQNDDSYAIETFLDADPRHKTKFLEPCVSQRLLVIN